MQTRDRCKRRRPLRSRIAASGLRDHDGSHVNDCVGLTRISRPLLKCLGVSWMAVSSTAITRGHSLRSFSKAGLEDTGGEDCSSLEMGRLLQWRVNTSSQIDHNVWRISLLVNPPIAGSGLKLRIPLNEVKNKVAPAAAMPLTRERRGLAKAALAGCANRARVLRGI
jgi:hypothetical protein